MATNKKLPPAVKLLGFVYPKVEAMLPKTAYKWANSMFYKPIRFPYPEDEEQVLSEANIIYKQMYNETLRVYSWGTGPETIVFAHGWSGRATQGYKFVEPLTKAGYRVVAFDAPAHGKSTGKTSDMLQFSGLMKDVVEEQGNVSAIIGHSMGGAAIIHALSRGMEVPKIVLISIPTIPDQILSRFREILKASVKTTNYIADSITKKYDLHFESIFAGQLLPQINIPKTLIMHDINDYEIPIAHVEVLENLLPEAHVIKTKALGHTRILRDDAVVKHVCDYVIN